MGNLERVKIRQVPNGTDGLKYMAATAGLWLLSFVTWALKVVFKVAKWVGLFIGWILLVCVIIFWTTFTGKSSKKF
jgi:CHASE2 domain-containing sensor protein